MANYGKFHVDSHFGFRPKEGLLNGQDKESQKVYG